MGSRLCQSHETPNVARTTAGWATKSGDALKEYKVCVERVSKHMKKLILIGGGMLLLLGAMVVGALFAFPMFASAQSNTRTATPSTTTATNPYCGQYLQDLATRLHVPTSTLQRQSLAAARDVLARMVKDGRLTQKQANAIVQQFQNPQLCSNQALARAETALVLYSLRGYLPEITNDVASGLHLTPAQLKAQLKSGKSLNEVAEEQHVSSAQLRTIVIDAVQRALNKAVTAGDVTQQQATTFMQYLRSNPRILNHILNAHHAMMDDMMRSGNWPER
jgi:polyhydroxyalkanoate synthesis regulator phasin